jgi:hypothetical protein
VNDEVDALYALPLDEFTAARNELAKRDPSVKALKKPSRAAWVVNQLARTHRDDVEALVATGRKLRKAQAEGKDFAAATAAERDALRVLVDHARALGAGSDAVLDGVRATLQAAAADEAAAEQVLVGRLDRELEAPGFDAVLAAAAAAPPRVPVVKRDRERERAEERRRKEAQAALRAAERAEAEARRAWEQTRDALERARRDADRDR